MLSGPSDPENGHAFMSLRLQRRQNPGVIIDTWGMFRTTDLGGARQKYCSVYSVLAEDEIIVATGQLAPNGFNWTQLLSDHAVHGRRDHLAPCAAASTSPRRSSPA